MSRRIGAARGEFEKLRRIWAHSTLARDRKIQIFGACVLSKLLYGLHTTWLHQVEVKRLDGFQASCLRKILRISHSYISRVRNEQVLAIAGCIKLSVKLLKRQLYLFAHVAKKLDDHPLRNCVFQASSIELRKFSIVRKRAKPRMTWPREVHRHAMRAATVYGFDPRNIKRTDIPTAQAWRRTFDDYCSNACTCSCA